MRCVRVSFKVLYCSVEKTAVRLLLKALVFCMKHGLYVFEFELICIPGGDTDPFEVCVRQGIWHLKNKKKICQIKLVELPADPL